MPGILVYSDVILSNTGIAAGVRGKNTRKNTRTVNQGGFGQINVDWQNSLRQFELGYIPMNLSQWQALQGLHEITDGGAYGFLMEDPKDNTVTIAEGVLLPYLTTPHVVPVGTGGAGYGVPTYRVGRRYSTAGSVRAKDRPITRPKAGSQYRRGASAVVLGNAPSNASIDLTTGLLTFVADSLSAIINITAGASTNVQLAAALAGLAVGDRLWLQGVTGADAALLNNKSHTILNAVGNTYTLSTGTAGKLFTPTGQGHKYPQPSETLTWAGGFYVPVHFMNDDLDWELVLGGPNEKRLVAGPTVMLEEVRE